MDLRELPSIREDRLYEWILLRAEGRLDFNGIESLEAFCQLKGPKLARDRGVKKADFENGDDDDDSEYVTIEVQKRLTVESVEMGCAQERTWLASLEELHYTCSKYVNDLLNVKLKIKGVILYELLPIPARLGPFCQWLRPLLMPSPRSLASAPSRAKPPDGQSAIDQSQPTLGYPRGASHVERERDFVLRCHLRKNSIETERSLLQRGADMI
ncbi:hypothetical protein V496_07242 [Pseudogymnoascus sp. VKM F-4515 (FW-2607)]|nr:hypothetical protein V496_07242 [Pseudogymnoascus sp. VKM F-4515 (FW-2607)]